MTIILCFNNMPVSQRVDQVEFRGNTAINSLFSEVVEEKETSI